MSNKELEIPAIYHFLDWREKRAVREEYIRRQEGKCCHCKCLLSDPPPEHIQSVKINWKLFPDNFLKYPVHLHHSHKTGLTIGSVHSLCNAVLWQVHGE